MNLPCAAVVRLSRQIEVKELGAMAALLDCNPPRQSHPFKGSQLCGSGGLSSGITLDLSLIHI